MRLRYVAKLAPPVVGFGREAIGDEISFLPLDRIWADDRFEPTESIEYSGEVASYNALNEGDLLLPKVSPTFAHGRCAIARGLIGGRALATSEVFVIRPNDPADTTFLQYRLLDPEFIASGQSAWTGVAGLKRVSADFVRDVRIHPLAWEHRHEIGAFLERESGRLRACRAAEVKMHEAALAAFRDWSASRLLSADGATDRLKYLIETPVGGTWGSEPGTDAVDVLCARVADFDREALTVVDPATLRSVHERDACRLALRDGDLLLEKSGGGTKSPVGFVARYCCQGQDRIVVSSNFIARLRPRPGTDPLYLSHLFGALYRTRRNEAFVKQNTGIQNLDVDAYLSLHVPARPLDEQRRIAREAQSRLDAALELRVRAERLRSALDEYRNALIHEAVMGKLDVSELTERQLDERVQAATEGRLDEVAV